MEGKGASVEGKGANFYNCFQSLEELVEFPGPLGTTSSGVRTLRVSSHWSGQPPVSPPQLLSGNLSLERPAAD